MANFVIQLPLAVEPYQADILDKRLEIGRKIYNALAGKIQNRYKEMVKTKRYRELTAKLTKDKDKNKPIWAEIDALRAEYRLTEYAFQADVKSMQKHFSDNIDAFTAQKIASRLWAAYYKLFYGNGEEVHFAAYGKFNSLEGKSNATGIRYINNMITWKGLKIPVVLNPKDDFIREAFKSDISYCRIVRRTIKGKRRYYAQIVFKGKPPMRADKHTGEAKLCIGKGDVGIDIGTSTIAYSSATDVKILELADKVLCYEKEMRRLNRRMDRSRRAMNPGNFNPDGTIIEHGNKKLKWNDSKRYLKCKAKRNEIYRLQAAVRKHQHEQLANEIISLGDNIYVETMNIAALAKRSSKTEKNAKGKFKRKKRFGKSVARRAPAQLLSIIDRKLSYFGKHLIKIDTASAKASQYNHINESYKKKKLCERWNLLDGIKVQRDMYSAFLIMNTAEDLKGFDLTKCRERFDNFLDLHNAEVSRLTGKKNLSSIGI